MLSIKEYLDLKDGMFVSFCKKAYVVRGKNDCKEPQLYEHETGIPLMGGIYGVHLMTIIDEPKKKEEKKKEAANVSEEETPSVEQPVKRKRGRPRKNP